MAVSPWNSGILHRVGGPIIGALVFALTLSLAAQSKLASGSKGPRAIAVLEWTADGARLIPVAIRIDGKYHDARLYEAAPVPMALYADTVYEVEHGGDSLGLFTIADARQTPDGWFGEGKFKSKAQLQAEHKPKAAEVEKPKPEPDQRPVLRRSKPAASTPAPAPPTSSPAPAPTQTASAPAAPTAPPTAEPKPASSESSDDSGRPTLKRGAAQGATQAEKIADPKLKHKAPPTPPVGLTRTEIAVSDASGPEPHSYVWEIKPDQLQTIRKQVEQIADSAVEAYAKAHPGLNPSTNFQDVHLNAYDLNINNEPYIVFTARVPQQAKTPMRQARSSHPIPAADKSKSAIADQPPASAEPNSKDAYVTVIARQDYDRQLRKVLTSVTDGTRLDVTPRLEFIDAVDADGDGRGDLLFRQVSDHDQSFVIYRVIGDAARVAFNSGAPQEE